MAVHAYAARAAPPARALLERFASEYDSAMADEALSWHDVLEHLAVGLETL